MWYLLSRVFVTVVIVIAPTAFEKTAHPWSHEVVFHQKHPSSRPKASVAMPAGMSSVVNIHRQLRPVLRCQGAASYLMRRVADIMERTGLLGARIEQGHMWHLHLATVGH